MDRARESARLERKLALAGTALLAIVLAQSALHAPGALGIGGYERLAVFVAGWAVGGAVFAAAVGVSLELREGRALWLVLAVAAALRVAPLIAPPFLSTDVFRYVWDGRVQNAGINPYGLIPSAPELSPLRDATIYPFINRSDYAPTIYPPAAQMVFALVARLSQTVLAMKLAMAAAEAIAIGAMISLLRQARLPLARVLIYAWNPVVVWEYAGNGHVDALSIALTGLAMLAAARGRAGASGVALAAATLTKFFPAVFAPALWAAAGAFRRAGNPAGVPREGKGERFPKWAVFPLAFGLAIAAGYACYASAGARVFGFLAGYAREEGVSNGGGIYVLQILSNLTPIPGWAAPAWLALAALAMGALALRMARRRAPQSVAGMGHDALLLGTVALVAVSPHYAWYFGPLAYLSCLAAWPSVIWLTVASAALYLDTTHDRSGWSNFVYIPFAILAARDFLRACVRGPGHAPSVSQEISA